MQYYKESFISIFESEEIKVFNDITPNPLNYLVSVEEYVNSLKDNYPLGIRNVSIPVDSAEIGQAIKTDEGYFMHT